MENLKDASPPVTWEPDAGTSAADPTTADPVTAGDGGPPADGAVMVADRDGNGVRDDVDQWLIARSGDAPDLTQALRGVAAAMQAMIVSTDARAAASAARAFVLARECVYLAKLGSGRWSVDGIASVSDLLGVLRSTVLNTWQRTDDYLRANQRVSGTSFRLSSLEDLAVGCPAVGKVRP